MKLETRKEAEAAVMHFLRTHPRWEKAVTEADDADLHVEVSKALAAFLWGEAISAKVVRIKLYGNPEGSELHPHVRYPRCADMPKRCVVRADSFIIDLTAKQLGAALPCPFIWEALRARRRS